MNRRLQSVLLLLLVMVAAVYVLRRGGSRTRVGDAPEGHPAVADATTPGADQSARPTTPSTSAAANNPSATGSTGGATGLPGNAATRPLTTTASDDRQISASALLELQALQREKASFTAAQQKLDSQLVFALKQSRNEPIAGGAVPQLQTGVEVDTNGRVLVDIAANITADLLRQVQDYGATILDSLPQVSPLRVSAPLAQLENLAALPDVRFIRPAVLPLSNNTDVEGVVTHRDDTARNTFLADGSGVKVGVLSTSVDYLPEAQTNGNLGDVTVLPGQSGIPGSGEGTAMLEIVHAMAPGAQLFFATGGPTEKQFATNILNLRFVYGCDVIVDDISYADESPFQDMTIARAVDTVTESGGLFFSSSANSGNLDSAASGTWEGDFLNGGSVSFPTNGLIHNFGTGGSPTNYTFIIGTNSTEGPTVLYWSDPLGSSSNDYDLFVLDIVGTHVVSASVTPQNGAQDPIEVVPRPAVGQRLVIVRTAGTNRFLHLDTERGRLSIATQGNTRGHNAATNAFSVAAVCACTAFPSPFSGGGANPVETFSSDGPRRMFYFPDGTPMTPGNFSASGGIVFQKPDIAAADGVSTDVPGFATFPGTSAAAPQAAAIAALIKSYNPNLTAAQIRSILTSTALDIMAGGVDRSSGYGLVMAYQALQATPAPPPVISVVSPDSAAAGRQVYIYGASFRTATNVQFNGTAASFSTVSNSLIIATVPTSATSGPLVITTPFGTAIAAFTVLPTLAPLDDDFANGIVETGNVFIVSASTAGASKESGEPNHAGNSGGKSVWYRWAAPASGAFTVDTIGSGFNTLLAVYTGNGVTNLSLVASNLNSGGNGTSLLTFSATGGTTYQIAVDGFNGASGDVVLRLEPAITPVYATAFEAAQGFILGSPLAGQNGWTTNSSGKGGNGVVSNYFAGQGQQAYLGFFSPTPATNTFLFRPLSYTVDTNTRPVIQFSVSMGIVDSGNFSYDQFWWIVRSTNGHNLFGLDFDNSIKFIDYALDSGGLMSGLPFVNGTTNVLLVTMDFGRNLWSATFNGAPITVFAQPITTTGAALTLGDIDAVWVFSNPSSPGNNYLLFDNYTVTAGPSLVPKILVPPQSQSVPAGSDVALSVAAEGNLPLTYQWSYNSVTISNATNASLTLRNVTAGQSGNYSVAVNNSGGSASATAVLTITNPPPLALFGQVAFSGAGGVSLNANVSAGNNYRFQASTNLTDWTTLAAFYGNGTTILCLDNSATNFDRRFYRLASP